jgi:5-formyltetrahydrofolate cyclo-ligase
MRATPSKAELRAAALAGRDALTSEQRDAAARAIAERGLPENIAPGTTVSGYSPIRGEIDPKPLMLKIAAKGARLALPTVTARGQSLVFRAWSPGDRLLLGSLGIPEPSPAFDRLGHRIGYGAGHYDYTFEHLRKLKPVIGIGLAYSVQEIAAVPALSHDVKLDYVLTETRVFDFRST